MVVRARRFAVSAVAYSVLWPTLVCVIVAKLVKFSVQIAARVDQRKPVMLEGVVIFVAVEVKPPISSEGIGASGG